MSTSLTLYELEDNLVALMDSEPTDEEQHLAWLDDLSKYTEVAVAKRDSVIRFLRHLDLQAENVDAEITRLSRLKASYEGGKARVERYVIAILEQLPEPKKGTRKLEGSVGVLSLAKKPDRTEVTHPDQVPFEYQDATVVLSAVEWKHIEETLGSLCEHKPATKRISYSPRKTDIKEAIQGGEEVPGAHLSGGENRLVVK